MRARACETIVGIANTGDGKSTKREASFDEAIHRISSRTQKTRKMKAE